MQRGGNDRHEVRLIGQSASRRALEDGIDWAARSDAKVLITGETGVGKEVVARLIHARSRRAPEAMVALNCAGLPDALLESELFGHVRGSFTDAHRDKRGLLELAANGTLFLDEVGEMSARMQAILLRFLDSGEIQRIGAERVSARVNVRLVAATHRDLAAQVLTGAFREDLYFRLNVLPMTVPPLRDRADDIPSMLSFFLAAFRQAQGQPPVTLTSAAMAACLEYRWPGNVRELKNLAERLSHSAVGPAIGIGDLPREVRAAPAELVIASPALARPDSRGGSRPAALDDVAAGLVAAMVPGGASFWTAVHAPFMSRDLTRDDLRAVVRSGLALTAGNYRFLVERFNMPPADYKRFLGFLAVHECRPAFQPFRRAAKVAALASLRPPPAKRASAGDTAR